jgi:putative addiction module component (TIGR02574 family)
MTEPTPRPAPPSESSGEPAPEGAPPPRGVREAAPALHPSLASLSVDERIALIGTLWDSLEPDEAAPITPELAAELDRRLADAEANPDEWVSWEQLRAELTSRLR